MSINNTLVQNQQMLSPSPKITPELNEWLDLAINEKANQMRFDPPSQEDFNPNSPINISLFGFKNPNDLKVFLLSPAGEAKLGEMGAKLAEEKANEDQRLFELQEAEKMRSLIKIHLLLWLMEKDAHAENVLREQIDLFNQRSIAQSKPDAAKPQKSESTPKASPGLQQALASYDEAIRQHQDEHSKLQTNETALNKRMENLVQQQQALTIKYDVYNTSLEEFAKSSDEHDAMTSTDLDKLIQDMELELDKQTDEIFALLDTGKPADEEAARQLLHEQNALNMRVAVLKDLLSAKSGDKVYFDIDGEKIPTQKDADGNDIPSQKGAAFIVGKDQQIVMRDNEYYLLNANEEFDNLSDDEKEGAHAAFKDARHEIMCVKQAVEHTHKMEKEFFDEEINDVNAKQAQNKEDKMKLENQIKLMQSVRATLEKTAQEQVNTSANSELNNNAPKAMPTPNANGKAVNLPPPPAPAITFAQKFLPSFFSKKKELSKDDLMDGVDKHAKNKKGKKLTPEEIKQIKDFLLKALTMLGLGTIPPMAPLPQTTMESLLTNMARFGADPYKPGLTPMQSPLQSPMDTLSAKAPAPEPKTEPQPIFNPSPFKKPY